MRSFTLLLTIIIFTSCSSTDDDSVKIDKTLLYGKWNKNNLCATQNNLVFNEDGSYVDLYSGNTCDSNANNTTQTNGQFILRGNKIEFNALSNAVIIVGDNPPLVVPDFSVNDDLVIVKLTESELQIAYKKIENNLYEVNSYTKAVD